MVGLDTAIRYPEHPLAHTLVFYVSGHGFGHASRDIEIINTLIERRTNLTIHVRTWAARWLFEAAVDEPVHVHHLQCDTGAAQRGPLEVDVARTIEEAVHFYSDFDAKTEREADALSALDADLVVGDIPPLAFAAAARCGIPAAGLGNFTWDWIYDGYPEFVAAHPSVLHTIRHAYAQAGTMWRLPASGGFESCPRVIDVPFVARRSRRDPADVKRTIGVPRGRVMVLISFGGFGLDGVELRQLDPDGRYVFVATSDPENAAFRTALPGFVHVDERQWYDAGYRYEDLVSAADAVVSKPGYGIISECIANGTPLLYTSRGRFREYDVLVREMPRYLRCRYIAQVDFLAGRWMKDLDALLTQPVPLEVARIDGAHVVAEAIMNLLGQREE